MSLSLYYNHGFFLSNPSKLNKIHQFGSQAGTGCIYLVTKGVNYLHITSESWFPYHLARNWSPHRGHVPNNDSYFY